VLTSFSGVWVSKGARFAESGVVEVAEDDEVGVLGEAVVDELLDALGLREGHARLRRRACGSSG
jgi:hypothetical protein